MDANIGLGIALSVAGSLGLYLASPNQRWLAAPLRPTLTRVASGLLLAASLGLLTLALRPLVAGYVFAVIVMLALTLLPYTAILSPRFSHGRGRR